MTITGALMTITGVTCLSSFVVDVGAKVPFIHRAVVAWLPLVIMHGSFMHSNFSEYPSSGFIPHRPL